MVRAQRLGHTFEYCHAGEVGIVIWCGCDPSSPPDHDRDHAFASISERVDMDVRSSLG
jgi:hypothetical protein